MSNQDAVAGFGILVAAFTDENMADAALDAAKKAKQQGTFYFEEAAVVRQDAQGNVKHHETGDMSGGKGAGIGAIVGGVIGILGGPGGMILGAGAGAAVGALAAKGDAGFDDSSLEQLGVALQPGSSALVAITSSDVLKAVRKSSDRTDVKTAVTNLANEISTNIAAGKDVYFGLAVTEEGVAVKEMTVDDEAIQVFGMVATEDGVAVGAAVVTEEGAAYEVGVATDEGVAVEEGVITDEGAVIVDAVAVADEDTSDEDSPEEAEAEDATGAEKSQGE